MTQNIFANIAKRCTPDMNDEVMNGLACYYIPQAMAYVDAVIRASSSSFPPGLEYLGCKRCNPLEEYNFVTKPKGSKREFDIAQTDVFMIMLYFKFKGEELPPKHLQLPFIREGGIINLRGSMYHFSPILTDKVISPAGSKVFIKILKAKMNFMREYHNVVVNGKKDTVYIVYGDIYKKKDNKKIAKTTDAVSCIAHYLFAINGVTGTFQKYLGFVPVFGNEEINPETYPPSNWVICKSIGVKPKGCKLYSYMPTSIRIAIPIEKWDLAAQSLVAGFYYVVDNFPDRMLLDYIDEKRIWTILLGEIIFTGAFSHQKLYEDTKVHFVNLSNYLDERSMRTLNSIGYPVNDFYDLIYYILRDYNTIIHTGYSDGNTVYNKNYELLYYAMFEITSGLNKALVYLNKIASKDKDENNRRVLETKDILKFLINDHYLKTKSFIDSKGKQAINTVSYSGDHKYPKITAIVTEQDSMTTGNASKRSKKKAITERQRLHTSMLEIGSMLYLPKSKPTPVVRINPYVRINLETGDIIRNPKIMETLDKTQDILKGITQVAVDSDDVLDEDDD